jgi:hypothetical protein
MRGAEIRVRTAQLDFDDRQASAPYKKVGFALMPGWI